MKFTRRLYYSVAQALGPRFSLPPFTMGNKRNVRKPSTAKTKVISVAAEPSRPKRASKPTYKVAQQAEEAISSEDDNIDQEVIVRDIASKLKDADLDSGSDLDIVEEDWKDGWTSGDSDSDSEVVEIRKDTKKQKKPTGKQWLTSNTVSQLTRNLQLSSPGSNPVKRKLLNAKKKAANQVSD
jgi:hypothetical protein